MKNFLSILGISVLFLYPCQGSLYSDRDVSDGFKRMIKNPSTPLEDGADLSTQIVFHHTNTKTEPVLDGLSPAEKVHHLGVAWRGILTAEGHGESYYATLEYIHARMFGIISDELAAYPWQDQESDTSIVACELLNLGRWLAYRRQLPEKIAELAVRHEADTDALKQNHYQMTALFMLFGVGGQFDWFQWYGMVPDRVTAAIMINRYAANTDFLPESKRLHGFRSYHDKGAHLAVAPSEERKPSTADMTPQQFFTLIQQFREFQLRRECERSKQHHTDSITFIQTAYSGEAAEAELAKEEKYFRGQINWHLSPESVYFNPVYYPVSVLDFGLGKAETCFSQLYMTTPFAEAEAAFTAYGVVPLRELDAARTKLVLGCGNYPADLSFVSKGKKHYGRDYHHDADTVDISAAMNPTIVGSSYDSGVYDYIQSQGKMYDAIVAEASPFITAAFVADIRKILNVGGTYRVSSCNICACVFPESLSGKVPEESHLINLFLKQDAYDRFHSLTGVALVTETLMQLNGFYNPLGLTIAEHPSDVELEDRDGGKLIEFGEGPIILRRIH